jgi:hypothetical protein
MRLASVADRFFAFVVHTMHDRRVGGRSVFYTESELTTRLRQHTSLVFYRCLGPACLAAAAAMSSLLTKAAIDVSRCRKLIFTRLEKSDYTSRLQFVIHVVKAAANMSSVQGIPQHSLNQKVAKLQSENNALRVHLDTATDEVKNLRDQVAKLEAFKAATMPFLEELGPAFMRMMGEWTNTSAPEAMECMLCLGTAVTLAADGFCVQVHRCNSCGMINKVCNMPECKGRWVEAGGKCLATCGNSATRTSFDTPYAPSRPAYQAFPSSISSIYTPYTPSRPTYQAFPSSISRQTPDPRPHPDQHIKRYHPTHPDRPQTPNPISHLDASE